MLYSAFIHADAAFVDAELDDEVGVVGPAEGTLLVVDEEQLLVDDDGRFKISCEFWLVAVFASGSVRSANIALSEGNVGGCGYAEEVDDDGPELTDSTGVATELVEESILIESEQWKN